MPELWILLLAFGSAARLTRLITTDTITGPLRAKVLTHYGPQSMAYELIRCPWCVGFWISIPAAIAAFTPFAHTLFYAIAGTALSISLLIGWCARNLDPQ